MKTPELPSEYLRRVGTSTGMKLSAIAKKIGIPHTTLLRIESGEIANPKTSIIDKVEEFTGISRGHSLKPNGFRDSVQSQGFKAASLNIPERISVPVYDVKAAAGRNICTLGQEIIIDDLTFKLSWLRRRTMAAPDKLAVIKVWGDSMEPSLSDGDDILIDLTQTDPSGGGIFLVRVDDALLVKRLQKKGGKLRILSDNEAYEPYESDAAEVVGRMIWQGRNW
jgi:phage repressor protein C with HTH and peptisase S24 domain